MSTDIQLPLKLTRWYPFSQLHCDHVVIIDKVLTIFHSSFFFLGLLPKLIYWHSTWLSQSLIDWLMIENNCFRFTCLSLVWSRWVVCGVLEYLNPRCIAIHVDKLTISISNLKANTEFESLTFLAQTNNIQSRGCFTIVINFFTLPLPNLSSLLVGVMSI